MSPALGPDILGKPRPVSSWSHGNYLPGSVHSPGRWLVHQPLPSPPLLLSGSHLAAHYSTLTHLSSPSCLSHNLLPPLLPFQGSAPHLPPPVLHSLLQSSRLRVPFTHLYRRPTEHSKHRAASCGGRRRRGCSGGSLGQDAASPLPLQWSPNFALH